MPTSNQINHTELTDIIDPTDTDNIGHAGSHDISRTPAWEDAGLLTIFIDDANKILAQTESRFLMWTKNTDDLFSLTMIKRNLHVIQGSANMMDLAKIANLAHQAIHLYDLIVSNELLASKPVRHFLYHVQHVLKKQITQLDKGLSIADVYQAKNEKIVSMIFIENQDIDFLQQFLDTGKIDAIILDDFMQKHAEKTANNGIFAEVISTLKQSPQNTPSNQPTRAKEAEQPNTQTLKAIQIHENMVTGQLNPKVQETLDHVNQQNQTNDKNESDTESEIDWYQTLSHWQLLTMMVMVGILTLWFKQASITSYMQQTYQITPPWQALQKLSIWRSGAAINHWVNQQINTGFSYLNDDEQYEFDFDTPTDGSPENTQQAVNTINQPDALSITETKKTATNATEAKQIANIEPTDTIPTDVMRDLEKLTGSNGLTQDDLNTNIKTNSFQSHTHSHLDTQATGLENINENPVWQPINKVNIAKHKKVFFVGDSMMEGVAPKAMRLLRQQYGIKSINLSKQNTGLSYSNFFDWPKTVENTIHKHDDIGLMVVFLGANDPWAVPNPEKPWKYVPFASKQWDALYQQKIDRLLAVTEKNDIPVVWMLIPAMKKAKLNKQITHLNTLYLDSMTNGKRQQPLLTLNTQSMLTNASQEPTVLITTRDQLTTIKNPSKFANTTHINGKIHKVRTGDGIHFTLAGQRHLAKSLLQFIEVDLDSQ